MILTQLKLGYILFAILVLLVCIEFTVVHAEVIQTENVNTTTMTTNGNQTTTIKQPPPSAVSPQFNSGNNSDLCTVGVAGAVQTQILGISAGTTFTEENCVRLKKAKTLYDMGMKVAAVSVLCTDKVTFDAMMMAGTPCPYEGKIGKDAKIAWDAHEAKPYNEAEKKEIKDVKEEAATWGLGGLGALLLLL